MDRNVVLAVILSTIVLIIGFFVQRVFMVTSEGVVSEFASETEGGQRSEILRSDDDEGRNTQTNNRDITVIVPDGRTAAQEREVIYEQSDFIRVVMNTRGGNINTIELLKHEDNGEPLKLFFGDSEKQGLTLSLGGVDGKLLDPVFYYTRTNRGIEFYQDIIVPGQDEPFQIVKRYHFFPDEYLFEMEVELTNTVNQYVPLNFDGQAYTVSIGPQIGPEFKELSDARRTDFRRFSYFDGKRRKDIRNTITNGEQEELEGYIPWAAINGKYFVATVIPGNTGAKVVFTANMTDDGVQGNQLHLVHPEIQSSRVTDTYRFYFGPKSTKNLRQYENAEDNSLGIKELGLDNLIESSWLGWLETGLKAIMNLFYGWVSNWGVSIILLTILVKIVLYPLTRTSYKSTARMKELGPKIQELKEKYQSDAQKLNQATMALYKKENVKPLGGCLPILLQFPFFIAMFSLFNNNFDLRGAVFIPGWIDDLSASESILDFGFTIPLLNWDALRLLPIIFLITQLITTKLTQPVESAQNNSQMKMLTLFMPIGFFFIMYNMPSGLLVYWIFQNIISTGQQAIYNYFTHKAASN